MDISRPEHEASMNFDSENVHPFLEAMDDKFNFGLDAEMLCEFILGVPSDQEHSMDVDINVSGKESTMELRVFMDDIDSPDLYLFFQSEDISEKVGGFMMEWAESQ